MESKNNGPASIPGTAGAVPAASGQPDADIPFTTMRTRIAPPANGVPRPGSREADAADIDRLAQRYSREAQLALEGLLYWGLRWPFELMAALVASGRKWEEEYYRPGPKRRVSLYDEETK
jgi:hypothetical protein